MSFAVYYPLHPRTAYSVVCSSVREFHGRENVVLSELRVLNESR